MDKIAVIKARLEQLKQPAFSSAIQGFMRDKKQERLVALQDLYPGVILLVTSKQPRYTVMLFHERNGVAASLVFECMGPILVANITDGVDEACMLQEFPDYDTIAKSVEFNVGV